MLLLAGLGNPGAKHVGNRHNIGFMAIDQIAQTHGISDFRTKFGGLCAMGELGGEKTLLLKPQTFMNESGISLAAAVNFYKLPLTQVVVFYDELDLAPGKLRMKQGGGLAGHNGLKSIKARIGNDFRRARLGIGHPGHKDKVLAHVLKDFTAKEQAWLATLLAALARHIALLVNGDDGGYQSRIHLDMQAEAENGL